MKNKIWEMVFDMVDSRLEYVKEEMKKKKPLKAEIRDIENAIEDVSMWIEEIIEGGE